MTLRDVAVAAGVSVATVSLALRDSPRITKKCKQQVVQVSERLGYVKDSKLSELMSHLRDNRGGKSGSTLAIVDAGEGEVRDGYSSGNLEIVSGLREVAMKEGFSLDCFNMAEEGLSARRLRQILLARGIEGVVVLPSPRHDLLVGMDWSGLTTSVIGYELEGEDFYRVCPNYLRMMDELMSQALRDGFRRFGFLPEPNQQSLRNRLVSSSVEFHLSGALGALQVDRFTGRESDTESVSRWLESQAPDFVIGSCEAWRTLCQLEKSGRAAPAFAAWDIAGAPSNVSGLDHRYKVLGQEAATTVLSRLTRQALRESENMLTKVIEGKFRRSESSKWHLSSLENAG
ncbi:LacI family DNA-binding transcriptional regulator [Pelagicoccus enzymogenes]|nr:LacI family DNA-binding transcriptional regulator [Pelagicoccus enzymogenes]